MNQTNRPLIRARQSEREPPTTRDQGAQPAPYRRAILNPSSVARAAGVHRSFIYRHPDLHAAVLARAAEPATAAAGGTAVSRRSLLADLANLQHSNTRMARHISVLERRLSTTLGDKAWQESNLGAPPDIDTLQRQITGLENKILNLRQLIDRTRELDAARSTNRELMIALNRH